jgi:hypothetical protein
MHLLLRVGVKKEGFDRIKIQFDIDNGLGLKYHVTQATH